MIVDQIVDAALSLEYSKQYAAAHNNLNHKQIYLLEQCVVCQHLSIHLDWQCYNPVLPMIRSQRQYRTKSTAVKKPLSVGKEDAMSAAATSTPARGRD